MAKSKIPDPLERRHLIERELTPAQSLRIAEAYLAQDRALEAVEFLRKGGARDRLEALREAAIAAGDAFLLRRTAEALEAPPDPAAWRRLRDAAEAAGKQRHAMDARRQLARVEE
jgi:hypothetical protein